jgi:3D (Asp-Asp-Asp) domain-containing protein
MQVSNLLRFTLIPLLGFVVVGCATQTAKITAKGSKAVRVAKVRTTAYTHTESGGGRNAVGSRLCGTQMKSAASDWSRFPLGTKFQIAGTNEQFVIDDYGGALVGTNTIDLYKTSRLAMRQWGVRHVDIDILEWGSEERSLKVLAPRSRSRTVKRMIADLQRKQRTVSTLTSF